MKNLLPEWEHMHHAYVLIGGRLDEALSVLDKELKFATRANPDAYVRELQTLGIDEGRELSEWAIKKPFGRRKVAILSLFSITSEAQNALLKLFEEPTLDTYFFLILPRVGNLLPTLLSRVHILEVESVQSEKEKNDGRIFLKSSIIQRLKIIAPIVKEKDKEKARILVSQISKSIEKTGARETFIESFLNAERFLGGRAPSVKMILEHLALVLPVL